MKEEKTQEKKTHPIFDDSNLGKPGTI